MTVWAVGDIHGVPGELDRVLDLIRADAGRRGVARPRVVFLGDYVDRGPDSRGVLDRLCSDEVREGLDPVFLLGNHDRALLAVLRGADDAMGWLMYGGTECVESYGVEPRGAQSEFLAAFRRAVPEAHRRLLSGMRTSHAEDGNLYTHAGLNPHREPLNRQSEDDVLMGHRDFLTWTGRLSSGRVVHGHWTSREVVVTPSRVGVDTACGMGGHLSAVAIDGDSVTALG